MSDLFTCARHRCLVYHRGGVGLVGELKPLTQVQWRRIRDDVSAAHCTVGTNECCDLLGDLLTIAMELHILRDDVLVWVGVITRIEWEIDHVGVFADDLLWIAKRTALSKGYSMAYPNIGDVLDRMDWLLRAQTFAKYGDPWKMTAPTNHLHQVRMLDPHVNPRSSRAVAAWSMTTWEDFDKYAEDMGTDYAVVVRDVYYWDINYAWATLPTLTQAHISENVRVVEYGSEFASGYVVTNGSGYAGVATADVNVIEDYGHIDVVDSSWNEAVVAEVPTGEELDEMLNAAKRQLSRRNPTPPASIVVPANSTLMPGSPWEIPDMIPGAWFNVSVQHLCRQVVEAQRLHEIVVEESAPDGETVGITCISAPATRINPT